MTARDTKFSDAMSSIPSFCRATSAATTRAISGSTSARERFKSGRRRTAVDMRSSGTAIVLRSSRSGRPGARPRVGREHRVVLGERVAVGHAREVVGDGAKEERLSVVVGGDLGVETPERDVPQVRHAREVAVAQKDIVRKEARIPVPRGEERRDDELRAPVVLCDAVAVDDVLVDELLELVVE